MNTNKLIMPTLTRLFLCFLLYFSTTCYAHEYSKQAIDIYVSSCTIGDYISQEDCECAMAYIQENLSEDAYWASIEDAIAGKDVKPETLTVLINALSAQCDKSE